MSSNSPITKDQQASARLHSQSSLLQPRPIRGNGLSITTSKGATSSRDGPSDGNFTCCSNLNKSPPSLVTVSASLRDVLCGRGLHIMNRQGNLNFHLLVNKYRQTYNDSCGRDKAIITRQIVEEIKSTGARFLRRLNNKDKCDDRWVEVDDKTAYNKVSHALRLKKSDHGRNFLKSVKIQESMNSSSNVATTARASVAPTPLLEVTTAPSVQHNDSSNCFDLSSLSPRYMTGLPPACPTPEDQLVQSLSIIQHPQVQSNFAPSHQPLQVVIPLRHASGHILGYTTVALDHHTVANAFGTTLAIMSQTAAQQQHQQQRSSIDDISTSIASQVSSALNNNADEMRQRYW